MPAPFVKLSDNLLLNLNTITRIQLNDAEKTASAFVSRDQVMLTKEQSERLYTYITRASAWVE
jgi:hypothetical protein